MFRYYFLMPIYASEDLTVMHNRIVFFRVSTCTPRHLSATMTLYLRSLGIEDGAEQARARKEVNPLLRSD